jgi:hypothetical protein
MFSFVLAPVILILTSAAFSLDSCSGPLGLQLGVTYNDTAVDMVNNMDALLCHLQSVHRRLLPPALTLYQCQLDIKFSSGLLNH